MALDFGELAHWVPQTLNYWIRQQEVDAGVRDGFSSDERARIK